MSQMPPVPPSSQSTKGHGIEPRKNPSKEKTVVKHEHHPNADEEGDTANIKQNTTNKGYYRGRRMA